MLLAFWFMQARGPFFACAHSDPNYFYFNNALNVATGQPANHVDNPGSTAQIIGGIIIRVITFFKGVDDIEKEVLLHPEYYLSAMNKALVFLNALALFVLGFFTLRWTSSVGYALLLQCAPFVSWQTFRVFVKVSPEPVLFLASIFLTMLLLRMVMKNDLKERVKLYTALFALIISFGLAGKLTFIPMALVPLLLLPGWRSKAVFLLATVALFHVFIIPAYAHYDYFIKWTKDLFLHSGHYGEGTRDIVNFGTFFQHLFQLLFLHHVFYLVIAIAICVLAYHKVNARWKSIFQNELHLKVLFAVTVAMMVQTLLVAKHYNPHYMVPYFALAPLLILLLLEITQKVNLAFPARWKIIAINVAALFFFARHMVKYLPGQSIADWLYGIAFAFFALVIALIVFTAMSLRVTAPKKITPRINRMFSIMLALSVILYCIRDADLGGFYQRLESSKRTAREVMAFTHSGDAQQVYCPNASSQLCALHFGASINFPQPERYQKLAELYDHTNRHFLHVDFTHWQHHLDSLLRQHGTIMLQADTNGLRHLVDITGINLKKVHDGSIESVYEVSSVR